MKIRITTETTDDGQLWYVAHNEDGTNCQQGKTKHEAIQNLGASERRLKQLRHEKNDQLDDQ